MKITLPVCFRLVVSCYSVVTQIKVCRVYGFQKNKHRLLSAGTPMLQWVSKCTLHQISQARKRNNTIYLWIAVITAISVSSSKRGERVNSALYWPVRLGCILTKLMQQELYNLSSKSSRLVSPCLIASRCVTLYPSASCVIRLSHF